MTGLDPGVGAALGNDRYRGQAFGWIFLVLVGLVNLGRGSIHVFKNDGGAASIAGIDLSQNGEVILSPFAAMGLTQILMGRSTWPWRFASARSFRSWSATTSCSRSAPV